VEVGFSRLSGPTFAAREDAMVDAVELESTLRRARALTDALFAQVRPEAFLERPIPERHRILFYLGHLEAFDWNLVGRHRGLPPVHASLDGLFAFGIDPPPGQLPADRPEDWPTLDETRAYVRAARKRLDELAADVPDELLHMAVEHRLMHAETFSYILHNLPREQRVPTAVPSGLAAAVRAVRLPGSPNAPDEGRAATGAPGKPAHTGREARWIEVNEGSARLGRARGTGFGWDNEFGEHRVRVPGFSVARHKVTNGEYLEFVEQGGPVPHYWVRRGDEWRLRGMWTEHPLPRDWPVYASHEQATGFADWKGARLPSEAQFQRAAYGHPGDQADDRPGHRFPWGDALPTRLHGHFAFAGPDPVAVDATPEGDSAFGVSQLVGNGWEWTRSVFEPFPGFAAHPAYAGYSANFFDGGHYVLKGAAPVTDVALVRRTFRNWFRPHYPYVYATFRLVVE
jgi:iron(II)-dependent oxidoreductase